MLWKAQFHLITKLTCVLLLVTLIILTNSENSATFFILLKLFTQNLATFLEISLSNIQTVILSISFRVLTLIPLFSPENSGSTGIDHTVIYHTECTGSCNWISCNGY